MEVIAVRARVRVIVMRLIVTREIQVVMNLTASLATVNMKQMNLIQNRIAQGMNHQEKKWKLMKDLVKN